MGTDRLRQPQQLPQKQDGRDRVLTPALPGRLRANSNATPATPDRPDIVDATGCPATRRVRRPRQGCGLSAGYKTAYTGRRP